MSAYDRSDRRALTIEARAHAGTLPVTPPLSGEMIDALQMFAVAASGGDPHMGMIGGASVRALVAVGYVRAQTAEERLTLLRGSVPTESGYARLAKLYAPRKRSGAL